MQHCSSAAEEPTPVHRVGDCGASGRRRLFEAESEREPVRCASLNPPAVAIGDEADLLTPGDARAAALGARAVVARDTIRGAASRDRGMGGMPAHRDRAAKRASTAPTSENGTAASGRVGGSCPFRAARTSPRGRGPCGYIPLTRPVRRQREQGRESPSRSVRGGAQGSCGEGNARGPWERPFDARRRSHARFNDESLSSRTCDMYHAPFQPLAPLARACGVGALRRGCLLPGVCRRGRRCHRGTCGAPRRVRPCARSRRACPPCSRRRSSSPPARRRQRASRRRGRSCLARASASASNSPRALGSPDAARSVRCRPS